MSNLKDNLVKIREKLDSDNAQPSGGGVLEEVKKIRQVLDTDNTYPGGGGLAEEITAIRELVEDGKADKDDFTYSQVITIDNKKNFSITVEDAVIDSHSGSMYYPTRKKLSDLASPLAVTSHHIAVTHVRQSNGKWRRSSRHGILIFTPLSGSVSNVSATITGSRNSIYGPFTVESNGIFVYKLGAFPGNTREELNESVTITIQ